MTPEQIEQMEAALAGATKGPWRKTFTGRSNTPSEFGVENVNRRGICSTGGYQDGGDGTYDENKANADLVALAPDMAAHIIALEARVKAAVEEEQERCAVIADIQSDVCGLDQNGALFVGEEAQIFASSVAHEISTAIRNRATGEAP
jgi:hypothetical protein